jgi:hypothetical protein
MRKLYLVVFCAIFSITLQAQTILQYESHALVANHVNEMKITKWVEPGSTGKNVVWDFRTLELTKDFKGVLEDTKLSKCCFIFPESNTQLEEFGNFFFFKTTKTSIEQHGFMVSNGSVHIIYDNPFVKMRYPFSYGSSYSGSFGGRYNSETKQLGTIQGSYAVDGDGSGTLLLPNGMVYEDALRVKEVKSYLQRLNNRNYDIETTTYRWYVNGHRFPILVLISSTTTFEDGKSSTATQAAYNPVALNAGENPLIVSTIREGLSFEAFPNPYQGRITIRFSLDQSSKINLSVYDVNGRLVKVLYNGIDEAGERQHHFSAREMDLGAGAYIVKLNVNGKETSKRILEL